MSKVKTLLVVNPVRSRQTAKQLTGMEEALQQLNVRYDLAFTERKGHGIAPATRAVEEGYETIIAVGGDGTVNEVVNGVVGSSAAVFSIPLGASNDFLRSLGIRTKEEACRVMAEGGVVHVDLGLAEYGDDAGRRRQRYYAVLADVGFGSEVVHNAPRRFRHALGGGLGYIVSLYRTAVASQAGARWMRAKVDGELRYDEKLLLVEALDGMYGGGGLKVAPKAKMDDGVLDVLAIGEVHWLQICALLTKIWRGTHIEDARTGYFGAREVEVEAERDTQVSVDGEVIGHTPVRLSVVPRALKVRCSAGTG